MLNKKSEISGKCRHRNISIGSIFGQGLISGLDNVKEYNAMGWSNIPTNPPYGIFIHIFFCLYNINPPDNTVYNCLFVSVLKILVATY